MMALRPALLVACLLGFAASTPAQTASSVGGHDVTVALFTTQPALRLELSPAGVGAWTARCATCPHQPLRSPLTLAAPVDLVAGGSLRVIDPATKLERTAAGRWHVRAAHPGSSLDVTLDLPSEAYVTAVLNAEADPHEPENSLRALAIVTRTYALNGPHYTAAPGHLPADLCDSTACQAVRFTTPTTAIRQAMIDTAGETLWSGGKLAQVYFSQHCGGITEDVSAWLPHQPSLPYLQSHQDPFCLRGGPAAWHANISVADLRTLAAREGWRLPQDLRAVTVSHRSASGRALTLDFASARGPDLPLPAAALRLAVGRALGWNLVRSDLYQVALRDQVLVFDGRGHGHGVGLCQAGAAEMAREGQPPRQILAFYLPGTAVHITPADEGWLHDRIGPIHLQSSHPLSPSARSMIAEAWSAAASRLPQSQATSPNVVFAPTAELFRQLTQEPGWNLAATRGSLTVLQPQALLAANRTSLESLLLHEFLHQRVEAEATGKAPLWLREGLVEILAGEPVPTSPSLSPGRVEQQLAAPQSRREAQAAHRAAGSLVQQLLRRYSLPTVRGWLRSGVPSDIG